MTDTSNATPVIAAPADLTTQLKAALINAAFAPINTALGSIVANPTVPNVIAQVAAAEVNLAAILPSLQSVGISDIAQLAAAKLAALKVSLLTPAPAAPVTGSAA